MSLEDLGPLLKSYFRYTVILKGKLSPYNSLIFVHFVSPSSYFVCIESVLVLYLQMLSVGAAES